MIVSSSIPPPPSRHQWDRMYHTNTLYYIVTSIGDWCNPCMLIHRYWILCSYYPLSPPLLPPPPLKLQSLYAIDIRFLVGGLEGDVPSDTTPYASQWLPALRIDSRCCIPPPPYPALPPTSEYNIIIYLLNIHTRWYTIQGRWWGWIHTKWCHGGHFRSL